MPRRPERLALDLCESLGMTPHSRARPPSA